MEHLLVSWAAPVVALHLVSGADRSFSTWKSLLVHGFPEGAWASRQPMHLPDAPLPEWVDDFDAFAAGFERSGFAGPLNRYRNLTRLPRRLTRTRGPSSD